MKRIAACLVLVMAVIILTGCKDKGRETNFIPTPIPPDYTEEYTDVPKEEDIIEYDPDDSEEGSGDDSEEPIVVGRTTAKYVKLNNYGALLNIRDKPSTESEVVGSLVHTEKINVIEIKDGWASFLYHDNICYVSEDYLVDKKPPYLVPPTPTPSPTPTPGTSAN